MTTIIGMDIQWKLFKKEIVDLSGSKERRKKNNGPDVIQEKSKHGKRMLLEEEIVKNVVRMMMKLKLDNGVLETPSNQKPVPLVISKLSIEKYIIYRRNITLFNKLFSQIIQIIFLADPCFNGEQDRYETGIDCGGDCKRKCSPESEREIPWLLSAAPIN